MLNRTECNAPKCNGNHKQRQNAPRCCPLCEPLTLSHLGRRKARRNFRGGSNNPAQPDRRRHAKGRSTPEGSGRHPEGSGRDQERDQETNDLKKGRRAICSGIQERRRGNSGTQKDAAAPASGDKHASGGSGSSRATRSAQRNRVAPPYSIKTAEPRQPRRSRKDRIQRSGAA